ncbi:hypothetical protein LZX74_000125 [Salmonella enterica]|nr:hypothetical protein [Salmonella enterica]EGG2680396.1 hypothetical protein [Salmonella enterica]EIS4790424.1 hypothetical protein [Salmonella enterica]EJZ6351924.1 hypothetical protein [Salmonella enterica]
MTTKHPAHGTNHPAHGPLSLERLHQIREILSKAAAQSDGGNLGYAMADAVKVIDGAIAAFGAEPLAVNDDMAYAFHHALSDSSLGADEVEDIKTGLRAAFASITAKPALRFIPAELTREEYRRRFMMEDNFDDTYRGGWSACRSAMLQAGNSPATPDGWQLVPKEPTEAMNKAGWAAMNEHDAINPTYRAMLAAAPQQEVKSALEHGMQRYAGAMQKLSEGDK